MRILELINRLNDGGAERVVSSLSLALQAQGNSVSIVCLRDLGRMPISRERLEDGGVELVEFQKGDGFSPRALGQLVSYLKSREIDVIHTHNPLVHHYGVLAALQTRSSIVVQTVHGISTLYMHRWAFALYRAACGLTDKVVSVCEAVNDAIRSRVKVSQKRTCVIDNGIELDELLAVPARDTGSPFVFGSIGRLVPVKDHSSLLQAFAILRQRGADCRLEILGIGKLESELRKMAQSLGVAEEVVFRGWSRDIAGFLSGIDALVLSSVSEGLPLTVLEAMAAGKPVVATAVGGVPEIIREAECGWLCEPSNPPTLAAAMIQAMDKERAEGKGARGGRQAIQPYSTARLA